LTIVKVAFPGPTFRSEPLGGLGPRRGYDDAPV
jgi:hypothetical protein